MPIGNDKWEVLLLLRDVVEQLFHPETTEASTYELDILVEYHHDSFLKVRIISLSFIIATTVLRDSQTQVSHYVCSMTLRQEARVGYNNRSHYKLTV